MNNDELKKRANNIRKNILTQVYSAQSGHPGGSLGAADIVTYLYFEEMNVTKDNLNTTNRDRFVLSKGHTSPCLYATLYEKGFIDTDLTTFRKLGSPLQGHPSMRKLQGLDMSTGSLGQGISTAVGMALANKIDGNKNNVYALVGDGESEEGLVWEAMMAAAHYKLDNFCVIFDNNNLQIDGDVHKVMNPNPLDEKAKAFGFEVINIDGNDFDEIRKGFELFHKTQDKPTAIIAHTVKGKGVSFMENQAGWHGKAPNEEEYNNAMKDLEEGF